MEYMVGSFLSLRRIVTVGLLLAGLSASIAGMAQDTSNRGRKYKSPPPTAVVEVTVLRASNGKPVQNASVIFHPLQDGKDSGNMELKTNDDGKALIDLLVIGSDVRVQVIAPGFQTYGEDFKVDKDKLAINIKLNRPTHQYSIYNKNEGAKTDADKPADKTPAPDAAPKDTSTDTPKDTPKPDAAPKDASTPKL
jgi:hypothetical protein